MGGERQASSDACSEPLSTKKCEVTNATRSGPRVAISIKSSTPQKLSGCEPTCEESVGAAIKSPARGKGRCGEIRMVPPPFGILGMWGTARVHLRRFAAQVSRPKGDTRNYSMRIRSLIPTGDTLQIVCTSAPLASREGDCVLLGDSKRKMVRMMSGSPVSDES